MKRIGILLLMTILHYVATAQVNVSGNVVDGEQKEGMIGATVVIVGTTKGAQVDWDGNFVIKNVKPGKYTLKASFMGYESVSREIEVAGQDLIVNQMVLEPGGIGLKEVNVVASVGIERKTPVAISTISAKKIEEKLGAQELPEVLNTTPGVYATKGSGGYGDSRINIRGFDQRNVAVLVNGIPVNDMENGWVYWSNWAGLGDATRTIQVQRGLGASKLAINSVGGTMNILTKSTDSKKGGSMSYNLSSFGTNKARLSLSSGKSEKGYAVSFTGSRTTGPGYVDGTYIDAWSYYLGVSKEINEKHSLHLTAIGAPQKHGQRGNSVFSAMSYQDFEDNASNEKYNPNWGYANGEFLNERNNFFHKPQVALNHYWTINDVNFLATSVYVSYGSGGGSGVLGKGSVRFGPGTNPSGQLEWDNGLAINDTSSTGSHIILRNSRNNHFWTGGLTTLKSDLSEFVHLIAGLDVRHYEGEHYREVEDLLGGEYWEDEVTPRAKVGDRIAYNDLGTVSYGGAFTQLEYAKDKLSAFIGGTVSNTWYGRRDSYNFARKRIENPDAVGVDMLGYNAKVGANFNINDHHNVYANAGYYSRAPFHQFVYINFSNDINPDLKNETIVGFEGGYGMNYSAVSVKLNAYATTWQDRWVRQRVVAEDGARYTAYFQVPSQPHQGVELEVKTKLTKSLELGGFISKGNWKYEGDFDVTIFDDDTQQQLSTATVFADGLLVPDHPQTQYALMLTWNKKDFTLGCDYMYNDDIYAKFEVAAINKLEDKKNSYQLPGYGMLNANATYRFKLAGLNSSFSVQAMNVLDEITPMEGWGVDEDSFKGFWTWGRRFNFGLKVRF